MTDAAAYGLSDANYAKLLDKTSGKPISEAMRRDLLSYYDDLNKPFATKRDPEAWQALMKKLETLRELPATAAPVPSYTTHR